MLLCFIFCIWLGLQTFEKRPNKHIFKTINGAKLIFGREHLVMGRGSTHNAPLYKDYSMKHVQWHLCMISSWICSEWLSITWHHAVVLASVNHLTALSWTQTGNTFYCQLTSDHYALPSQADHHEALDTAESASEKCPKQKDALWYFLYDCEFDP